MRTMSLLAALAVVGMVAGFALAAAPVAPAKASTLEGTFVKVDGAKLVLTVKDKETTVATTDKTTVTLDGKDAKLADLKAGVKLVVTLTDATAPTAAKVEATTPVAKTANAK
jgi:hypothetical protein